MRKFSLIGLLVLVTVSAVLLAIVSVEMRPLEPKLSFTIGEPRPDGYREFTATNHGFRPLWCYGIGGGLNNYSLRIFGSSKYSEGERMSFGVLEPEYVKISDSLPTILTIPEEAKQVQIGLDVYDWRGRKQRVWSDKLSVD
jgi:hypothetical protein